MIPVIELSLPRRVERLFRVEVTSRCNLRCSYCTSPNLGRAKLDMSPATFARCLEHVAYFAGRGTQGMVDLAGIGEPTIHPELPRLVAMARDALGPGCVIRITSNAIAIDDALASAVAPHRPSFLLSTHSPRRVAQALRVLGRHGIWASIAPCNETYRHDWAGQVVVKTIGAKRVECGWIRDGMVMVMADGRVTTCCLDARGVGVIGHVDDPVGSWTTEPYELCRTCHLEIGVAGYDQRANPAAMGSSNPVSR